MTIVELSAANGRLTMQGEDKAPVQAIMAGGCQLPFPGMEPEEFKEQFEDLVNHPSHYTRGKIEVLDFIEDQGLTYHEGQVVKYICRARYKENEVQDKKKARFYLDRDITNLESNA